MLNVYALRDSAANCFGALLLFRTDAMAIRALKILVQQDDNAVARNPADYELFRIGDFDDTSGMVLGCEKVSVIRAVDLVKGNSDAS